MGEGRNEGGRGERRPAAGRKGGIGDVVTFQDRKCFSPWGDRVVYVNMSSITVLSQMGYSYGNNISTHRGGILGYQKGGYRAIYLSLEAL